MLIIGVLLIAVLIIGGLLIAVLIIAVVMGLYSVIGIVGVGLTVSASVMIVVTSFNNVV